MLSNDGGVTSSDTNDLFGMQFLYDWQRLTVPGVAVLLFQALQRKIRFLLKKIMKVKNTPY